MNPTAMKMFSLIIGVAAACAIIIGISQIDSPSLARMHRFDGERLSQLQLIQNAVMGYKRTHEQLPPELSKLNLPTKQLQDVETTAPYEYTVKDNDSYTLCAVFSTPSEETSAPVYNFNGCGVDWKHTAGKYCYTLSTKACR